MRESIFHQIESHLEDKKNWGIQKLLEFNIFLFGDSYKIDL